MEASPIDDERGTEGQGKDERARALQGTMEKIEIFGEFEMKMSQHEF